MHAHSSPSTRYSHYERRQSHDSSNTATLTAAGAINVTPLHAGTDVSTFGRFREPSATVAPPTQPRARKQPPARPGNASPPPALHPNISYTRPNTPAASFGRQPRRCGAVADSASSFTALTLNHHRPSGRRSATPAPGVVKAATLGLDIMTHTPSPDGPMGTPAVTSDACSDVAQPMRAVSPSLRDSSDHTRATPATERKRIIRTNSTADRHATAASTRSNGRPAGVASAPGPGSYDDAAAAMRCSRLRSTPATRFGGGGCVEGGKGARNGAARRPRRSFGGDSVSSLELREPARAQDWLGKRAPTCTRWTRPDSADGDSKAAARRAGTIWNVWPGCVWALRSLCYTWASLEVRMIG